MNHKKYLFVLTQILAQKNVSFTVCGMNLSLERSVNPGKWNLTTLLLSGMEEIPSHIKECISSRGSFRWLSVGPHLSLDDETGSLSLIEEIPVAMEYLPFKELVYHFTQVAIEWEEMLCDFHKR